MLPKLPYAFRNPALLAAALTHRSVNHSQGEQDNQRLEFLGDTVLDLAISEYLFTIEPRLKEGHMTHIRAGLVCEARLVEVARNLELGAALIMDSGEEGGGGRRKPSILADAMEAVLGAAFLDGGYPTARKLIRGLWSPYLDKPDDWAGMLADHKSRLQELIQGRGLGPLRYELMEAAGPAHARRFTMAVFLGDEEKARATAASKKDAEQRAAREVLAAFQAEAPPQAAETEKS